MKMYGFIKRPANSLSEMALEELWMAFPIVLAEHNPAWAGWYEEEKAALLALLGNAAKQIDHIGSTSAKGILAKPIVDILLQVSPECSFDWLKSALLDGSWQLMSEQASPGARSDWNKGYAPSGFAERVFHLHVRQCGDWDELRFRDCISSHPQAAADYETLKRRLLGKYKYNRDAYTQAKGAFIRGCLAKARGAKQ
jgi:GrpB-like predicted nucleotidyltransferase (UPF0157 family)